MLSLREGAQPPHGPHGSQRPGSTALPPLRTPRAGRARARVSPWREGVLGRPSEGCLSSTPRRASGSLPSSCCSCGFPSSSFRPPALCEGLDKLRRHTAASAISRRTSKGSWDRATALPTPDTLGLCRRIREDRPSPRAGLRDTRGPGRGGSRGRRREEYRLGGLGSQAGPGEGGNTAGGRRVAGRAGTVRVSSAAAVSSPRTECPAPSADNRALGVTAVAAQARLPVPTLSSTRLHWTPWRVRGRGFGGSHSLSPQV